LFRHNLLAIAAARNICIFVRRLLVEVEFYIEFYLRVIFVALAMPLYLWFTGSLAPASLSLLMTTANPAPFYPNERIAMSVK
jgi:hypothetical protein